MTAFFWKENMGISFVSVTPMGILDTAQFIAQMEKLNVMFELQHRILCLAQVKAMKISSQE